MTITSILLFFGFPIALCVIFALKVVYLETRNRWSVRRGFEVIEAELDSAADDNNNERGVATRPAATERRDDHG